MNKFYALIVLVASFALNGCSASASVEAKRPAPGAMAGSAAVDPATGQCVKGRPGATDQDYVDCLERMNRAMQAAQGPAPQQPQASQPAQPPQPQFPGFQPPPAAAPPFPTPGPALPPGYYPAATGAACTIKNSVLIEIENKTDYYLQVYAPTDAQHQYIIPLNCDVALSNEVIPALHNATGVVDTVLAIKPRATAKYVFLPFNGGFGDAVLFNVKGWDFNRVTGGMVQVPSTEIGYATFRVKVPNPSGDKNWTGVSASQLTSH